MPKLTKILLLAASVALVITVFLGVNFSSVRAATGSDDTAQNGSQDGAYRQINVYSEVLRHIQTDYVVDPNITTVTNGALRGLLESLDANSSYLTPAEYKTYKDDRPGRAQIGANVSKRLGYAAVVSVIPGSVADHANLADGDIIEAINDQDTRNMSLVMIRLLLDGPAGSQVTLSVVRPPRANPDRIVLTRAITSTPPVTDSLYENATILYLKPTTLDKEHVSQMESKLKGMSRLNTKKVLLDLRDVASGDMPEAVRAANLFLKSGPIAELEGQTVAKQSFTADPSKAVAPTAPLVVLVNRGTAGPAELLAAALLEDKRAELVGEHTFGEGVQQKLFELPDGAALVLSIAKYESPSGKRLQDDGVTPGTLVAAAQPETDETDTNPAQNPSQTSPTNKMPAARPTGSGISVDDQLSRGLDLLKGKAA